MIVIMQDKYALPIMDAEWGADEEYLMMEGIQMYGLGNWQDIADHIGTKTLDETREHYIRFYVNSPGFPLPAQAH
jgi:transcriptional adapter 2-alpha